MKKTISSWTIVRRIVDCRQEDPRGCNSWLMLQVLTLRVLPLRPSYLVLHPLPLQIWRQQTCDAVSQSYRQFPAVDVRQGNLPCFGKLFRCKPPQLFGQREVVALDV